MGVVKINPIFDMKFKNVYIETNCWTVYHTGLALSQLDKSLPIGPRAQFYRSWCKLTGNLGRPKLFPIGLSTS